MPDTVNEQHLWAGARMAIDPVVDENHRDQFLIGATVLVETFSDRLGIRSRGRIDSLIADALFAVSLKALRPVAFAVEAI